MPSYPTAAMTIERKYFPTNTAYSLIHVQAIIYRVHLMFDATVIVDTFPLGICFGSQELRSH